MTRLQFIALTTWA